MECSEASSRLRKYTGSSKLYREPPSQSVYTVVVGAVVALVVDVGAVVALVVVVVVVVVVESVIVNVVAVVRACVEVVFVVKAFAVNDALLEVDVDVEVVFSGQKYASPVAARQDPGHLVFIASRRFLAKHKCEMSMSAHASLSRAPLQLPSTGSGSGVVQVMVDAAVEDAAVAAAVVMPAATQEGLMV